MHAPLAKYSMLRTKRRDEWWLNSSAIDVDFQGNRAHDSTAVDTNLATTVLMLHGNGTDGSTNIIDSRGHFVFSPGDCQIDTAQSKFGGASILINTTITHVAIEFASAADIIAGNAAGGYTDLAFGTGAYTIDLWVRRTDATYDAGLISFLDANNSRLMLSAAGDIVLYQSGVGNVIQTAHGMSLNVWYHIALTRSGTNTRIFIDGTQVGSTYTTDTFNYPPIGQVGAAYRSYNIIGWMEEVRALNGTAAWTANFTAPTAPYNVGIGPYDMLSCSRASEGYAQTVAGTLTAFAANQLRITDKGLLVEDARTNVVLWNRDLTNGAWTPTNITAVKDQTGPDGVASSASKITASAGNGTILQAITLASSARYQSTWVKRVTGSGTVNMTMDNGSTWTAITVTAGWTLVEIPTQTLANPTVGFRIVTSGDAIAVDFVQNENGIFASSPISTTTAAATRAADAVTLIRTLDDVMGGASASCVLDIKTVDYIGTSYTFFGNISGTKYLAYVPSSNTQVGSSAGGPATFGGGATWSGGVKVGFNWDASAGSLVGGGGTVVSTSGALGDDYNLRFNTSTVSYSYFRRLTAWSSRLADATLQSYTDPAGPAPSGYAVDLNFEDGEYDLNQNEMLTMLTCTRASIGYAQTVAGTLTQFAANQLRITTAGLLVEDARTNIAFYSQTLSNAAWTSSGVTITDDATAAPDGTTTADLITATSGGTEHKHYQLISSGPTTGDGTASFYVKAGTSNFAAVNITGGGDRRYAVVINLTSGAITDTHTKNTLTGTPSNSVDTLANGWFRVNVMAHDGAVFIDVGISNSATPTWDAPGNMPSFSAAGTETIYVWGAQAEAGTFASSYVPTTTAAATRARDVVMCAGTLSSVWAGAGAAASAYTDITAWTAPTAFDRIIGRNAASNSVLLCNSNNTQIASYDGGNPAVVTTLGNSLTFSGGVKVASAWDSANISVVGGGGTVASGTFAAGAQDRIGGDGSGNFFFGKYRRITAWNTRLADATLQGFTNP